MLSIGRTKTVKSEEKSGVKGALLACKNLAVKGLIGKHSFIIMPLKLNMKLKVTCLVKFTT
jgi:hypothetical protein